MNEMPPTAVNWQPKIDPDATGALVLQGLVGLIGWNLVVAILLWVAHQEMTISASLSVVALAASNVVIAASLVAVGWRGGLADDRVPDS